MHRASAVLTFVICFAASASLVYFGRQWLIWSVEVPVARIANGPEYKDDGPPPPATENPPRLVIDQTRIDLGEVARGQSAQFAFVLKNEGVGPLAITAKPGCGCTVVRYEKVIPPGGEGRIETELRTSGLSGSVSKSVDVQSNDPARPRVSLVMAAKILSAVEVLPSPSPTLALKLDGATQLELHLRSRANKDGQPIEVTGVQANQPYVQAALHPADDEEGGRLSRLAVSVQPEAPLGRSEFRLTLTTTAEFERQITIPVRCEKGIIVSPASILLTPPRPGGAPPKWMVMLSKRDGNFHIRRVTSSDPLLEARTEPVKDGSTYRVAVSWRGEPGEIAAPCSITVETDDPHQPRVEIPVRPLPKRKQPAAQSGK